MRVLMVTRGSTGHLLPLVPFAQACARAGHEVLVAAQAQHRANVERTGLPYAPLAEPPPEAWMPLLEDFGELSVEEGNVRMIRDYFARLDTHATLPSLRALVEAWRPDVIVRESWEFASTLVAEAERIPLAEVAIGLSSVMEQTVALAAPSVDAERAAIGLPPDPSGSRLRAGTLLTSMPAGLDGAAPPAQRPVHRFRDPDAGIPVPALPDWWSGSDAPLVYATFGTVAPAAHLPYFPALYRALIDALAALPVRGLVTIGAGADPAALGPVAPNVHVERWVPQGAILPHAAAVVGHGGHGTTIGALAHGLPLVVMPLFSLDQWENAAAVAKTGAGISLDGDRARRRVLSLPPADVLHALGPALEAVLGDEAFRDRARAIAGGYRAAAAPDAAVGLLEDLREPARA